MTTRRYQMTERAETTVRTQQRIVRAAVRLHARNGVRATRWDDIAATARTGRATVYRHFPDLAALVPACARAVFAAIDLPDAATLEREFADPARPELRLARLIRQTCECYERGAGWLRAAERESDLVPELAGAMRRIRSGVAVLLEVVLRSTPVTEEHRRVIGALLDFSFWRQLRQAGIAPGAAADTILELALSQLAPRRYPAAPLCRTRM